MNIWQMIINGCFALIITLMILEINELNYRLDWSLSSNDVKKIVENCEPRGEISYSKELEYGEIKCW